MPGWPPLTLDLPASRGWRLALATLAAAALLTVAAWWRLGQGLFPAWLRLAGGVLGTAAVVLAWTARGASGARLRWDGQGWWLQRGPAAPETGCVTVALDLGGWMLLRFDASAPPRRRWLPVDRAGLGGDWHALRCAVYSARPAPGASSAAAPPAPDE